VHSYTEWLENGKKCRIIYFSDMLDRIKNDPRDAITIYYKLDRISINTFFDLIRPVRKKIIVVSGCSDYSITDEMFRRKPHNIVKWYGENVESPGSSLIPLPMGSLSSTWIGNSIEGCEIPCHADFKLVPETGEPPVFRNLVFMCFSIETNQAHRGEVYRYLSDKEWVTNLCKAKTGTYLSDDIFMENVYSHHYVISPMGNGIDCGRTWMTLQLGCIPILPHHPSFEVFAEHLPILLYRDTNELTESYLRERLEYFRGRKYSYDYLKTSYWKNRFEEDKIYA